MPLNIDITQILLHMFNFAILFAAVYFLLYNPIKKFMDNRNEKFDKMAKEAEDNFAASEKARKEYEEKQAQFNASCAAEKAKIINEATKQAAEIVSEANKKADSMLVETREKANKEKEAIVKSAYKEISELARETAEKVIFESSSDAYDKFLESDEG